MSKEIKIKNLTVKIGNTEVEVTVKEAKDLKKALDELFRSEIKTEYVPSPYPVYPHPWYERPYVTWLCDDSNTTYTLQQQGNVTLCADTTFTNDNKL